jgi:site-specific DNA-methyltransferase (adenine-specific)
MKPYYQDQKVVIYKADYKRVIAHVGKCDSIITDPPYGETSLKWDRRQKNWLAAARRVTNSIWCFGSLRMFLQMARDRELRSWTVAQEIVWEKHNGSSLQSDRFRRVHELAMHLYRGPWSEVYKNPVFTNDATARQVRRKQKPTHWSKIGEHSFTSEDGGPRMMRSVIFMRSCHGSGYHPTQKPLGILEPLIEYSCPPGGLVFDPFMGSGSTLIAANRLGMRAIGCEVNRQYCDMAIERLAQKTLELA